MSDAANATSTTAKAPTPPAIGGVIPYLMVDGAAKAADFYIRAFGAEKVAHHPEDEKGRTMHIHLYINGMSVMLADAYPEYGKPLESPQGFTLHLFVDDVDALWARAVAAGMTIELPLELQFWGDRYGQLRDPFGVLWSLASPGG